jgi:hypothetical protein
VRGEKILTRLASGFVFLLAKPEFCSHLASWLVVIRTPVLIMFTICMIFSSHFFSSLNWMGVEK